MITLIGSKVGCFGGMGFVAAATDAIVMSEYGRLGLTGPEVIEQEMGKEEFDSSDRALVFRTTGGRHKYIMGDCNMLVHGKVADFREALGKLAGLPVAEFREDASTSARRNWSRSSSSLSHSPRRCSRRTLAMSGPRPATLMPRPSTASRSTSSSRR